MIGKNVSKWLENLKSGTAEGKNKAANNLLGTSEWYFDDKKVTREERLDILNRLISIQNDPDPIVRNSIVYLIGILKISTESINRTLEKMLKDEIPEIQVSAVWAAGNLGKNSASLVPVLVSLSSHPDREVRWRIPWALREIGFVDNSLSKTLVALAKDKDSTARMYALDAIPFCLSETDSKVRKTVKSCLKDRDGSVRGAACRVIQKTDPDWKAVKSRLERLVKTDVHGVQLEAVLALCKQWPEMSRDPTINKWLNENKGYWWAENLINGVNI